MPAFILTILDQPARARALLDASARLSQLAGGARIRILVIRTPPLATILPTEEMLSPEDERTIRAAEAARAQALRTVFDPWAAAHPAFAPIFIDQEGETETLVQRHGAGADYIVAGRPDHPARPGHDPLHVALFATDRPVLMLPPHAPSAALAETVAIAWRPDACAPGAVLAALRLLPAGSRLHVLMGRRPGAPPLAAPEIFAEHGLAVTCHELPIGPKLFGAALLEKSHELGATLLVMGAFAHNAWHRLLFGGVTDFLLRHADIPVLLRH